MSYAVSTMQLPSLINLFTEKNKLVKELAASLKIQDVQEDARFEATVNRIKRLVLLSPVSIGEPKISGHYETTQQVGANYQNMWGGSRQVFVVTVSFPFTGSPELFGYIPSGVSFTMGRVHQPSGSSIPVEVTIPTLDKALAIREATNDMDATFSIIAGTNPQVENWSKQTEPDIEAYLQQKRKELLDFYS